MYLCNQIQQTKFLFINLWNKQWTDYVKTLLLALLIPVCTYASGWNDEEYKRIEQSILLPKLETTAKKYDISKFGAKVTNPAAQNQKAINRLIALVSKKGGGKVIIPKGT